MTTLVLIVVAVALVVSAVALFRAHDLLPWPAIGLAAVTTAICFTVGGATGQDLPGPDPATVGAAGAGVLCVAAAILALVPRSSRRPSLLPVSVATVGVVGGALGLLLSRLTG